MTTNPDNLKAWIHQNEHRILEYKGVADVGHDAIDSAHVIDEVVKGIRLGSLNAIELGCDFVIADFRAPFGKTLKCDIYNSLRKQTQYIDKGRRLSLSDLAINCIEQPYPPSEAKALMKLVKALGASYTERVVKLSSPVSVVGRKHVSYLENCS